MRVLGIIPARGGSKGVPRKNIKLLCGKPLLAYTIEGALKAKLLTRTILSTDDTEIARVGQDLGVDLPFMRPAELAADDTPTFPLILHAVETLEARGETYDAVCLLQPTNPLRTGADIDACIELLETSGADSVISVLPVPHAYNPNWVYLQQPDGRLALSNGAAEPISRRQDLPPAFHRDGSVYVARRSVITAGGNLYGKCIRGCVLDAARSINIDTEDDWEAAESLIAKTQRESTRQVYVCAE